MPIFDFESIAVVTQFQTKFFGLVAYSRFELASVSILERVGQRFLSDMQKIFLPWLGYVRVFGLGGKMCV